MNSQTITSYKPSSAFVGASWAALLLGMLAFMGGLWSAEMQLSEKGFYFAVLVQGLYSAISLQKTVRDKLEGVAVTGIYYGISWLALVIAVVLLGAGLFNASLQLSEKGFYAMAFALALFGAIAVQKNTRDNLGSDDAAAECKRIKSESSGPALVADAGKPAETQEQAAHNR